METDKSKWCAAFLRKVRKQFHDMKSKDWLRHLLGNPKNFVITRLGAYKVREDADFGAEARNDLAALFANFTHLNLPEGAALGVGGRFWNMNGSAYLTIRLPGKESFPVSNIAPDPMCVESIWENEVLAWMSSQLYLLRFAGEKKPNEPPKEQLEKTSRDTSEDNHDKVDASFDLPEEGGVSDFYLIEKDGESDFEVTEEGEKAVFPHWCGICY